MTKATGRITKKKLREVLQFDQEKFNTVLEEVYPVWRTKFITIKSEQLIRKYLQLICEELGL